jgi:hypothetical protein
VTVALNSFPSRRDDSLEAHSVRLESAELNVPFETTIACARISSPMEPRAVPLDWKSL